MNILIADDHFLVLDGLETLLSTIDMVDAVYKAVNYVELKSNLTKHRIDVIFLDINFGNADGRELLPLIRETSNLVKVIALTSFGDTATIKSCIHAGFNGFLLKSDDRTEIINALNAVKNDEKYYSSKAKVAVFENEVLGQKNKLSEREIEIVKLIVSEKTNKEIAQELFISEKTVENHRANIMLKMDVKNVAGLVKKAILQGIIDS